MPTRNTPLNSGLSASADYLKLIRITVKFSAITGENVNVSFDQNKATFVEVASEFFPI